jgi:hypothetical protein
MHYEFTVMAWVRYSSGTPVMSVSRQSYTTPGDDDVLTFGITDGKLNFLFKTDSGSY